MNSIIVIPALNPPERLIPYIDELIQSGVKHVIVVDDGSSESQQWIFDRLRQREECIVLVHKTNLGKGRALKDAFSFVLNRKDWEGASVITADSDGQHLVSDILRLDARMQETAKCSPCLFLGCRNFEKENIPWRSRFGNRLTSVLFRLLYKASVMDTQTGLRGIPYELLGPLSGLKGERFEYEMNMLTDAALKKIPFEIVEIETVYLDNNSESHFRPVTDSFRIYKILLGNFFRYCLSSVLSSLLDLLIFSIAVRLITAGPWQILAATVTARIFSSLFNYCCNRKLVFKDCEDVRTSLLKYYTLCIFVMFCSAGLVTFFSFLPVSKTVIKIVVDSILYLFNYYIQRHFIFPYHSEYNRRVSE